MSFRLPIPANGRLSPFSTGLLSARSPTQAPVAVVFATYTTCRSLDPICAHRSQPAPSRLGRPADDTPKPSEDIEAGASGHQKNLHLERNALHKSDPLTSGFEIKRPKFVEMRKFAASHPDYIPEASGKHALCGAILANNINGVWMAETQGFEPWEDFHPRRFSRPVHSTTLPSLRRAHL